MAFYNEEGSGLLVSGDPIFNASIYQVPENDSLNFSQSTGSNLSEYQRQKGMVFEIHTGNLDFSDDHLRQDNSFIIKHHESGFFSFSFILVPFKKGFESPLQLSKYKYD
jgi:hypothetical protein